MIELTIDGNQVSVESGTKILDAALSLGISIPTMCHNGELPHFTSCMICMVKEGKGGKLITSCSVKATQGMSITTLDDEIREARKTALDLLLSDHVGDCQAPCQTSCPAHMDIPLMNFLLAEGKFSEAYDVVIKDIALPSILGRICPAPCEGACRRKSVDAAVSICLLKRFTGDSPPPTPSPTPTPTPVTRHSSLVTSSSLVTHPSSLPQIAIIGSGPHGLSAAWYLQQYGYQCTIFDNNPLPGGGLRYSVPRDKLPEEVLDREIDRIRNAGAIFLMSTEIGLDRLKELEIEFDAVVHPLEKAPKMAIKASALGKEAALKIHHKLRGQPVTDEHRNFHSHFGRLTEVEHPEYMKESVPGERVEPAGGIPQGMTPQEVMTEAARCMHCECRKPDTCLLRIYAHEYGADQKRYHSLARKPVTKQFQHDTVVFEPQKCIKCSICVRITAKHQEEFGLTFIGRGFDVVIGVPFSESIRKGLTHTAEEAANSCPTGALAMKRWRL
jgi:ferredoxin